MTDTAPQVAAFDQTAIQALSPEQRTHFNKVMTDAGFPADKVAAATASSSAPPVANDPLANLRKNFTGSEADLRETLQRAGIDPNAPKPTPAELRPELNAPASPLDYELSFVGLGIDEANFSALNSEFRTAFKAGEIPKLIANGLMQNMIEGGAQVSGMNETARMLFNVEQSAILARVFGNQETALNLAAKVLTKMPAATVSVFKERGYFDNAMVVSSLAKIGQIIEAREKAK
jgi:hypothetical protein